MLDAVEVGHGQGPEVLTRASRLSAMGYEHLVDDDLMGLVAEPSTEELRALAEG